MLATLSLVSCLLAPGQLPPGSEWPLPPKLIRGQELFYRGTFHEESTGTEVQFSRAYRLESRIFVLDVAGGNADMAILTILKSQHEPVPRSVAQPVSREKTELLGSSAVRLELARINALGRVLLEPASLRYVPLEGPPTLESGMFVEMPTGRAALEQTWETTEEGRPVMSWTITGTETATDVRCIKLVGVQQSLDWDRPRPDRIAWRRREIVWLSPRTGAAQKLERTIERRDPARPQAVMRSVLRYDLESSQPHPGKLQDDRQHEITQARTFSETGVPLLSNPSANAGQIETLLGKINNHLEHQPPTPYREAIVQFKQRLEAARRGEAAAPALPEETAGLAAVATIGKPAPDFVAPDFTSRQSARLQRWLGRPILMIFYKPESATAADLLLFAQKLQQKCGSSVAVVGLSMSDDAEAVREQRAQLQLTFPMLGGSGLHKTYAIEATPKVVLLDSEGIVRGEFIGWGFETPREIVEELRRWMPGQ